MRPTENEKRAGFPASLGDRVLVTYLSLVNRVEDALEDFPPEQRKELQKLFHLLDQKIEALLFRKTPRRRS